MQIMQKTDGYITQEGHTMTSSSRILADPLLPCPRCGTHAERVHGSHIRCANIYNCDCETRLGDETWNRRAQPSGQWMWQPIETAPRDSTSVLLVSGYWITVGHWHPNRFWCCSAPQYQPYATDEQPTHWMPLPSAPEQETP